MKLFRYQTIIVALFLLLGTVTASAEETLTNRSVERMVAAGLSPEIITSKIQSTKSNFNVSIDEILALKKAGIHDDIIKAMIEAGGRQNPAPRSRDESDRSGQYDEPGQRYDPNPSSADSYQPQRKMDPVEQLLANIEEAAALKEKKDYSWKTKVRDISVTLKTIYPANTHNIKYWWAYTQYSVLVEKEHHILKGLKKVLYFDGNHEDALILKGDTLFAKAKRSRPGDDDRLGSSREDVADDAKKAYKTALGRPGISATTRSKIYYQLGLIAQEIDQSKMRSEQNWQKAMEEDPRGKWGLLAAKKLGVVPPQTSLEQEAPPVDRSPKERDQ